MKADPFYQRLVKIAAQRPYDRYIHLAEFHTEITINYLNTIRSMSDEGARKTSSDGQTLAQIIGYISEWERFTILAAGEIIAGVEWPRIMNLSGYIEPDGQLLNFASIEEFKAYQLAKHKTWPWQRTQDLAIHTATALHTLFTQPALLSPDSLERTRGCEWRLPKGLKLAIPAGWYLWMITLEHQATKYAADLGWDD